MSPRLLRDRGRTVDRQASLILVDRYAARVHLSPTIQGRIGEQIGAVGEGDEVELCVPYEKVRERPACGVDLSAEEVLSVSDRFVGVVAPAGLDVAPMLQFPDECLRA